ncbi:MAG TPA: transcriptional repressor [Propionicimonas sp.]|jgi:Fur family ferric uptake transcriptional regulator|uniref:Fur family transcriptional regulator n=1 Tax=Propionicimonas sp. TaxID=1955623 RepID=UPI002F422253
MTSTDLGRPNPRQTRQRAEIRHAVEALASFATAQDVHDRLRHEGSGVGLATVYRTLQAMAGGGELDSIRTPDGQIAYRTCSPGHHHHLICRTCGRTVEVTVPQLEQLVRGMASDHGFASIDHEVEFFGVCTACAAH